jgi:hypothetical protein
LHTLYLDDQVAGTYSGVYGNGDSFYALGVGKTQSWSGGNGDYYFYTGSIARVAFYTQVLTQSQVTQNCKALQSRFSTANCH